MKSITTLLNNMNERVQTTEKLNAACIPGQTDDLRLFHMESKKKKKEGKEPHSALKIENKEEEHSLLTMNGDKRVV